MIKPQECTERIVGDLNGDCMLSPYETCLLSGNSTEVCDCVEAGGNLDTCLEDEICKELKKIKDSPNFANSIAYLKTKATGSIEHAWVYKYLGQSTNFAPPTVAGHVEESLHSVNLNAFIGAEWLGAFHNHTSGEAIKMFSPEDLEWFITKATIKTNRQPPSSTSVGISELFLGLVNVNEVYCIKIKDWNKFYNLKNVTVFKNFEKKLLNSYKKTSSEGSQIQLQKDFLKVLKELDLGIGLYEQDNNGVWNEIKLDPINNNNNPVQIPCN